jgi:hypothetical protein
MDAIDTSNAIHAIVRARRVYQKLAISISRGEALPKAEFAALYGEMAEMDAWLAYHEVDWRDHDRVADLPLDKAAA